MPDVNPGQEFVLPTTTTLPPRGRVEYCEKVGLPLGELHDPATFVRSGATNRAKLHHPNLSCGSRRGAEVTMSWVEALRDPRACQCLERRQWNDPIGSTLQDLTHLCTTWEAAARILQEPDLPRYSLLATMRLEAGRACRPSLRPSLHPARTLVEAKVADAERAAARWDPSSVDALVPLVAPLVAPAAGFRDSRATLLLGHGRSAREAELLGDTEVRDLWAACRRHLETAPPRPWVSYLAVGPRTHVGSDLLAQFEVASNPTGTVAVLNAPLLPRVLDDPGSTYVRLPRLLDEEEAQLLVALFSATRKATFEEVGDLLAMVSAAACDPAGPSTPPDGDGSSVPVARFGAVPVPCL